MHYESYNRFIELNVGKYQIFKLTTFDEVLSNQGKKLNPLNLNLVLKNISMCIYAMYTSA